MAQTMLWGTLPMALAFWMYSIAVALTRVRAIIRNASERHTERVKLRRTGIASASFFAMGGYALYVWGSLAPAPFDDWWNLCLRRGV